MAIKVAATRADPGKDINGRYTYSMHMQVQINLELPDFRQALASLMPKGVEISSLELDHEQLVLQGRAPMIGAVTLTARVKVVPNRLTLSSFDLKGAGLMKALILSQLRQKLAELEYSNESVRFWGDCDGSFAYLSW
ncbi:MAG: hypothetical protein GY747_09335 [Planctomycetes bacterium]|nr:hypothetical protein [Planctomycetota bacterium]MCP4770470.1 hypothetical protein [Planctomycetota bacterium]MCP4859910.1 hypothetical protein [Planctomycetota bacterium]